jgi:hypothetical protein
MEAWDLRILGDVGGSSALNPMPAEEQPQILRLGCASLGVTAMFWCGEKTTTKATADPSTSFGSKNEPNSAQDDSFVVVRTLDPACSIRAGQRCGQR